MQEKYMRLARLLYCRASEIYEHNGRPLPRERFKETFDDADVLQFAANLLSGMGVEQALAKPCGGWMEETPIGAAVLDIIAPHEDTKTQAEIVLPAKRLTQLDTDGAHLPQGEIQ